MEGVGGRLLKEKLCVLHLRQHNYALLLKYTHLNLTTNRFIQIICINLYVLNKRIKTLNYFSSLIENFASGNIQFPLKVKKKLQALKRQRLKKLGSFVFVFS